MKLQTLAKGKQAHPMS